MVRPLVIALVSLVALGTASPALAGGWSQPSILERGCPRQTVSCTTEPAPRVALDAAGVAAATWVGNDGRVRVAVAGVGGRFGRPTTFERAFRPSVSVSDRGAVTVVWSRNGLLRFVRRAPGGHFTSPATLVPRGSVLGDDFPRAVAEPDGATLVVFRNAYRTRAGKYVTRTRSVVLGGDGRPRRPVAVTSGAASRDGFASIADGEVAIVTCCTVNADGVSGPGAVVAFDPGEGWRTLSPVLGQRERVESAAPGAGEVALGTVDVVHSGESGTSGTPGLRRGTVYNNVCGPLLAAPVGRASLAFGPVATIDGSRRSVLLYQEKSAPKAFSRVAPLYAVTASRSAHAFGARQRLDAGLARFPQAVPYRSGALAAWEAPGNRWGVAIERAGRFGAAPAPTGGPSNVGEDFLRNRDLAAAGRFAALVWSARDGSIRASVASGL